ncbi:DUF998 domain-containing protein [Rhodococcus maanshanensis]|uniref:DUF998 domain-containing protein n=1 Tax=Rhodococcus maanshanensis TaxID=183556 RepID=A0A1H7W0K2_9NOCA|nr:DUF998 domain-containing protein [Rhodococcus maanshanensis]SEM15026.1 Protein of unknown function [Rhodococcus maanshanensis]
MTDTDTAPDTQRWVRRILIGLLALGAVLYSSWMLEWVLPTGLDPSRAYVSELAALDQPYGFLFRTGDLLTGIVLATAAGFGLALRPRRLLTTIGWVGLAVFAVSTFLDSRMPLACSAHGSSECASREEAGLLHAVRSLHAITSSAAATAAAVSVFAFILAAYRYGWPRPLRWYGLGVVGLYTVGTVWTLFAVDMDGRGDEVWLLGYAQRLQLIAVTGWIVFAALIAAQEGRRGST